MRSIRPTPEAIPYWLAIQRRDALLTQSELASLLGYKNKTSFTSALSRGCWPEVEAIATHHPEFRARRVYYPAYKVRNLIRNLIKENAND